MSFNEDASIWITAKDLTQGVFKGIRQSVIQLGATYLTLQTAEKVFEEVIVKASAYQASLASLGAVAKSTFRDHNQLSIEMERHLGGIADKAQVASAFLKGMTTELSLEQYSQLAQRVKEASLAMGEDFGEQLPLITKAIKQLNPAILDNIGVTIRLDQLNTKIKQGFYGAGRAINEATQQNAIYQEVMKQTAKFQGQEEAILKTSKGQFMALRAAVSDLAISIGSLLTESTAVATVMGILTTAIRVADGVVNLFTSKTGDTSSEAVKATEKFAEWERKIAELTESLKAGEISLDDFHLAIEALTDEEPVIDLGIDTPEFRDALLNYITDIAHASDVTNQFGTASGMSLEQIKYLNEAIAKFEAEEKFNKAKAQALAFAGTTERAWNRIGEVAINTHETITQSQETSLELQREADSLYLTWREEYEQRILELEDIGLTESAARRALYLEELNLMQEQSDAELLEAATIQAANELGVSKRKFEQMLQYEMILRQNILDNLSKIGAQIGSDFRRSIHQFVENSDKGAVKVKEIFDALGKSLRATLIDIVLDAIMSVVKSILGKIIPALLGEGIAVKALTRSYISLAAAKAAVSPWSAGGRIAAAAVVKGSLSPMLLGFDDPRNDDVARRHGRDYAREFMQGQQDYFAAPGYGQRVRGMLTRSGYGTPMTGGGAQTTIVFNSPVVGTDFVLDELAPRLEDAAILQGSLLTVHTRMETSSFSQEPGRPY